MSEAAAWRVVVRGVLFALGMLLLLVLIRELRAVLIQLLLAVLIAAAMRPIVDSVADLAEGLRWRWRPSRGATALVVFFFVLLLGVGMIMAIVSAVIPDFRTLAENLPQYVRRAQATLNDLAQAHPEISGPLVGGGVQLQLQDLMAGAAGLATQAPQIIAVATGALSEVVYLLFSLILALYLTVDGERIRQYLVQFFPFDRQEQTLQIADRIGGRLGAWARGEAVLGAIVGGMTWIAALVLSLPYAAAVAVIAAVGELIPGLGPFLAAVPLVIVGFLSSPSKGLIAIGVAIAIQQLENNLIAPRVMGHAVDLHPLVVMVAILAGAELLGIVGALVAVPVAASIAVVIDEIQRERVARHEGASEARVPLG